MSIISDAGQGAAIGSAIPGIGTIIGGGIGLLGGILGSSGASAARRRQQQLEDEALGSARENYAGRGTFRNAAQAELANPTQDWSSIYDPSMYHESAVAYNPSEATNTASSAASRDLAMTQNIDRLQQVRDALKSFDASSAPQLDANIRKASERAAATGSLGSGTLNTSLGDLALNQNTQRQALEDSLIQGATGDSINDRFRALNAAQQERQFGVGQDEASYERAVSNRNRGTALKEQGLSDRLRLADQTNQDRQAKMARALGYGGFGYGNDPSNLLLQVSGRAGQRADDLGNAAGMNFSQLGQLAAGYGRRRPPTGSSAGIGSVDYGDDGQ